MDRLWAGWRSAYITTTVLNPPEVCLFCGLVGLDDTEAYILERTPLTLTVMNAYPYTAGHVMVAPLRHEADLEGLSAAEGADMFAALQRAVTAIKTVSHPHGLNLGVNLGRAGGAGVLGHIHAHALPRWDGDTNFMTVVAESRVISEGLRTTYDKLKEAWPR